MINLAGLDSIIARLAPAATMIAAAIAALALLSSREISRTVMRANMLRGFTQEFDGLLQQRYVIAQHAVARLGSTENCPSDVPTELWQVMDFFDRLSMYLKRGYLDERMAFISFFYWMLPYWTLFQGDVGIYKSQHALAMWDEIPRQVRRLERVGMRRMNVKKRGMADSRSSTKILEFFQIELRECAPRKHEPLTL